MNLRRIKTLAGLAETITNDAEQNDRINTLLQTLPQDLRTPVLDALEIVYMAGQPITIVDWAAKFKQLNPQHDPAETLKLTAKTFQHFIKRVAPKTYAWEPSNPMLDDPEYQQISPAVDLAHTVTQTMRELETFTLDELAQTVAQQLAVDPNMVRHYVNYVIQQFSGSITKQGDRYTWTNEPKTSGIDTIKNLLNRPPE
jgi:hypothetical protein